MSVSKLVLELPKFAVPEKYRDKSNTTVPIEMGFYGNIVFEAWNEFEELTTDAINEIEAIDDNRKWQIQTVLSLCQEEATKPSRDVADHDSIDDVVKQESDVDEISSVREFTNCDSTSRVIELFFLAVENTICTIRQRRFHLTCLNFSIKQLEVFRRLGGTGDLNWERIKPDFSLSEIFTIPQDQDFKPCATVEFKGPARKLFSWDTDYEEASELKSNLDEGTDAVPVVGEDVGATDTGGPLSVAENSPSSDDGTETAVGNTGVPRASGDVAIGNAVQLARFCNLGFASIEGEDQENEMSYSAESAEKRPPQCLLTPVSQAITQGLISESGCCSLFNFQHAIAFKICGMHPEKPGKVKVLVSRMFECDAYRGTFAAMVALMLHADKLKSSTKRESIGDELRIALQRILRAAQDQKPGAQNEKRPSESTIDSGANKRSKLSNNEACESFLQPTPNEETSETTTLSNDTNGACNSPTKQKKVGSPCIELDNTSKNCHITVKGYSGFVQVDVYNDEMVVRKRWNGEEVEGLDEIWNEVEAYKELANPERNDHVSIMPALRGLFNERKENAELIVQHVGVAIAKNDLSKHFIGEDSEKNILNRKELDALREATLDALRTLHERRWSHGDIALRNLRVRRLPHRHSGKKWLESLVDRLW